MSVIDIFPFVLVIVIWLIIRYMRNHYILGQRAIKERAAQNLCSKYNKKVIRGKDGRFKSVQSPHISKV